MSSALAVFAAESSGEINLKGGWDKVWGGIETSIGTQLTGLLTVIGVCIVIGAILKWMWERRRGGGGMGQTGGIMWSLLIGATLASPTVIIPIFLTILDAIANAVVGIWVESGAGG